MRVCNAQRTVIVQSRLVSKSQMSGVLKVPGDVTGHFGTL